MKRFFWLALFTLMAIRVQAQNFEILSTQDSYKGLIGQIIKAPLKFKNNSDKPLILIIRKVNAQIGSTQKNYFCLDNNCADHHVDDYAVKLEAGQTLTNLHIALEAGLALGSSSIKYLAFNKFNPADVLEFDVNFMVEEKIEKEHIYSSSHITLHDVYPNPVKDHAFVDYKMQDDDVKAKIIIHNILGNPVDEYILPALENKIKIKTESLSAGIYFYTLYIDNEGVITRKLIIKK